MLIFSTIALPPPTGSFLRYIILFQSEGPFGNIEQCNAKYLQHSGLLDFLQPTSLHIFFSIYVPCISREAHISQVHHK